MNQNAVGVAEAMRMQAKAIGNVTIEAQDTVAVLLAGANEIEHLKRQLSVAKALLFSAYDLGCSHGAMGADDAGCIAKLVAKVEAVG